MGSSLNLSIKCYRAMTFQIVACLPVFVMD